MSEVVHAEDEILGKAYDARLMRRIFRYLKPYWRLLLLSLLFLALYSGTQLLGPYITKVAIDRYIANQDLHGLDQVAWLYLGNVLLGFVFLFIQTYTMEYTGQRAMHDLRTEIFTHLQKQDLAYFDRRNSYEPVINNATELTLRNEMAVKGFLEFDLKADELARIQANETLSLPGSRETLDAVGQSIIDLVQFGLPDDYYETFAGKVRALKTGDVDDAAKLIVHPDNMVWVVVGDRSKVEAGIKELGLGEIRLLDADGKPL